MGVACATGIHFRKPPATSLTTPTRDPLASSTQSSTIATESKSFPSIANAVARVTPAVVSVVVFMEESSSFSRGNGTSGSGVIFDERGYILTNNHVIEGAHRVNVTLADGRVAQAKIRGTDRLTDLAILEITADDLTAISLGDSTQLRVGDWVVAIGNALGLPGGPTATVGIVSALGRSFQVSTDLVLHDLVQTDASINPGNSGGPLVNLTGEVIGINSAVFRGSFPQRGLAEGIGFAVSSDTALAVSQQIINNSRVIWPWLGINVRTVTPVMATEKNLPISYGVLLVNVVDSAPADIAGLESQDILEAIDGLPIKEVRQLQKVLREEHKIGDTIIVTVARGSDRLDIKVTLAEMPR
jgi:S1-C subfamily serine protease